MLPQAVFNWWSSLCFYLHHLASGAKKKRELRKKSSCIGTIVEEKEEKEEEQGRRRRRKGRKKCCTFRSFFGLPAGGSGVHLPLFSLSKLERILQVCGVYVCVFMCVHTYACVLLPCVCSFVSMSLSSCRLSWSLGVLPCTFLSLYWCVSECCVCMYNQVKILRPICFLEGVA